jgi:WD40 repeat protein
MVISGKKIKIRFIHAQQMSTIKQNDNPIIKRQHDIQNLLYDFFPKDICRLISKYDYYLKGKSYTLRTHDISVARVAVLPDEKIVIGFDFNCADCTLKVWNSKMDKGDIILTGHRKWINCIIILPYPDGRICTGSNDGTIRIWNDKTGKCEIVLNEHDNGYDNTYDHDSVYMIGSLANDNSHPDRRIVSMIRDSWDFDMYKIWNLQTKKCDAVFKPGIEVEKWLTLLPDGKVIGTTKDRRLVVWNPFGSLASPRQPQKYEFNMYANNFYHFGSITCAIRLRDGRIVTGTDTGNLALWNKKTKKCEFILKGHTHTKTTECNATECNATECNTTKCIAEVANAPAIKCIAELPDGRIVSRSSGSSAIKCIAELPDGRIVSGSSDATLKVWNIITKNCEINLYGHTGGIKCVAVCPEGFPGGIISCSYDGTIKIWS